MGISQAASVDVAAPNMPTDGPLLIANDGDGPIVVPDPAILFRADFDRDGPDLVLQNTDGPDVRILEYFGGGPVDIVTADGGRLSADLVQKLAGPVAPGQYAQIGNVTDELPIGQVELIEGTATVQRTDGTEVVLELGSLVFQGDVVSTGEGGSLSLTFVDETQFTLSANARMVLDELIYSPGGDDNSAVFNLVEGGFVFVAGQVAQTGDMAVETPTATLGIRGTTVLVSLTTVLGAITVAVTLQPDFDTLTPGTVELRDLDGNLITTITSTDTTWVIPLGGDVVEIPRTEFDQTDSAAILQDAADAFGQVVDRLAAGGQAVDLGDTRAGESTPNGALTTEDEVPLNDGLDSGPDPDPQPNPPGTEGGPETPEQGGAPTGPSGEQDQGQAGDDVPLVEDPGFTANNVALVGDAFIQNVSANNSFDNGLTGWADDSSAKIGPQGETLVSYTPIVRVLTGEDANALIPGDDAVAEIGFSGTLDRDYWGDDDDDLEDEGINVGTAFGPSLTSDTFSAADGDVVFFRYQVFTADGAGSGDDALITAELVNVDTGEVITVFTDQTQLPSSSGVQTVEVPITEAGTYEIVFTVGSFDGTDGGVIGASIAIGTAGIVRTGAEVGTQQTLAEEQFLDAVTDVDGDLDLSLVSVEGVSAFGATVSIDGNGDVVYNPSSAVLDKLPDGEQRVDTFDFTVEDQFGRTSTATASITVVGTYTGTDPIVLDLDGDGVELTEPGVPFDIDADGEPNVIGWVAPDDGLLVVDGNGNGSIDDGTEMFSEVFEDGSYANSLEALRLLDSNLDGVIDASDDRFDEILVWQDQDGDGETDDGELTTLGQHGIVSLNLDADAQSVEDQGNTIFAEGTYTTKDGETGTYVGVSFGELGGFQLSDDSLPVLPKSNAIEPLDGDVPDAVRQALADLGAPVGPDEPTLADLVEQYTQGSDDPSAGGSQASAAPGEGPAFMGDAVEGAYVPPPDDDLVVLDTVTVA